MAERSWIADAALALLAVVVIAFAGWVAVRDPEPPGGNRSAAAPTAPASDLAEDDAEPRSVLVLGDETVRGERSAGRWITELAGGEVEVDNRARPQTGYVVEGVPAECGLPACPSLMTMLTVAAAAAPTPDVVLVSAGRYDATLPEDRLRTGVTAFFDDLRAAYPDAEVVVLSPMVRSGAVPARLARVVELVTAEAEAIGASYVDAGQPYLDAGSVAAAGEQLRTAVDEVLNP